MTRTDPEINKRMLPCSHCRSTVPLLRAWCALVSGLLAVPAAWAGVNPPYEVGTWRGFKPAAISYTFDDGCSNQFSLAVPMFDEKGYKLTLFTVINTMFPGWDKLRAAATKGHEIASHTLNHADLRSAADAQQVTELQDSQATINANVTSQKCVTMAYPFCGQARDAITSRYYIAARTCSGQLVPSRPANFMAISSLICGKLGPVRTAQDFQGRAAGAASANAWLVYLIHGIDDDGGYSPLASATLKASLDYLSANPEKFWVDTFGNVARYIREREAVTISEVSSNAARITIQVSDRLDNAIYDYPISVRRPLPPLWGAVAVAQNDKPVPARIIEVNAAKYVSFDVVPDAGEVTLSRAPSQAGLSRPKMSAPDISPPWHVRQPERAANE